MSKPIVMERGVKYRDADKMALIPVKNVATEREALLRKPEWMKIKLPADSTRIQGIKAAMRKNGLHSVCEEASCPNLAECFNHGTATFMILGAICTRRCPFCDVAHGRPVAPDANEPVNWHRPLLIWRCVMWLSPPLTAMTCAMAEPALCGLHYCHPGKKPGNQN